MCRVSSRCSQHQPLSGCLICAAAAPKTDEMRKGGLLVSDLLPSKAAILITNPRRGAGAVGRTQLKLRGVSEEIEILLWALVVALA